MEIKEKIKAVNNLLEENEPASISHDTYSGYTGYKPQWIVASMNKFFGYGGWGFNELKTEITAPDDKGNALAVASVEVWLAGIENKMSAYGQSRVTRGDIGDAMKGAQTDALKKALSYFDIGQRAYFGLLDVNKKPVKKAVVPVEATPEPQIITPDNTFNQYTNQELDDQAIQKAVQVLTAPPTPAEQMQAGKDKVLKK